MNKVSVESGQKNNLCLENPVKLCFPGAAKIRSQVTPKVRSKEDSNDTDEFEFQNSDLVMILFL